MLCFVYIQWTVDMATHICLLKPSQNKKARLTHPLKETLSLQISQQVESSGNQHSKHT